MKNIIKINLENNSFFIWQSKCGIPNHFSYFFYKIGVSVTSLDCPHSIPRLFYPVCSVWCKVARKLRFVDIEALPEYKIKVRISWCLLNINILVSVHYLFLCTSISAFLQVQESQLSPLRVPLNIYYIPVIDFKCQTVNGWL